MWWNKYIAVPFVEKGRDETGCDCWGLASLIYRDERKIDLPGYLEAYESTNNKAVITKLAEIEKNNRWIEVTEPKPYDIVLLNISGMPVHVGIVTKNNYMIHCSRGIGTVHECFDSMRWKRKVEGFYRYE